MSRAFALLVLCVITMFAGIPARRCGSWSARRSWRRGGRRFVTSTGALAYGALPEVDDLFRRQAKELDKKKREVMLHQIQRTVHDQVTFASVYHLGFPIGIGPRVEDILTNPVPGFYLAPFEELKLKAR